MLSEEELDRANALFDTVQYYKEEQRTPMLTAYDIEWLTTKVRELNSEITALKKQDLYCMLGCTLREEVDRLRRELYRANKDQADFRGHYEG
jgi:hypothetical protein